MAFRRRRWRSSMGATRSSSVLTLLGNLWRRMSIRSWQERMLAVTSRWTRRSFGEEHQGDHDQRHVVMPGLPASDPIVGHAAGALGILESPYFSPGRTDKRRQAASGSACAQAVAV